MIETSYAQGYYCNEWGSALKSDWGKFSKVVSGIKQVANDYGSEFYIVIINDRVQTTDSFWMEYTKSMKCDYNRLRPNQEIQRLCDSIKTNCLDLYSIFKDHESSQDLYFEKDGHWNEYGHELAADRIFEFLTSSSNTVK